MSYKKKQQNFNVVSEIWTPLKLLAIVIADDHSEVLQR